MKAKGIGQRLDYDINANEPTRGTDADLIDIYNGRRNILIRLFVVVAVVIGLIVAILLRWLL